MRLDPVSQGLVDATTGFGDGVYSAITLGLGDLQDVRDLFDIDGGIDKSSSFYCGFETAGNLAGGLALGGAVFTKGIQAARNNAAAARAALFGLRLGNRTMGPHPPGPPPIPRPPVTGPK